MVALVGAARRCLSAAAGGPGWHTAALEGRSVLRLEGADVYTYLQGLVTNDVRLLQRGPDGAPPQPLYTALLSSAGRVLYDAFLHPAPPGAGGEPAVLADVTAEAAPQLAAHLARFRLRARVGVADAGAHWAVWARTPAGGDAHAPPPVEPDARAAAEGWRRDPRLPELGWRALLPRGTAPSDATSSGGDAGEYALRRLALGVAEGAELAGELPLELNLDGLGAVSFAKGCYVGQELTSRTHFRGVVRKRALPVALSQAAAAAASPGAAVLPAAGGAAVGRMLAVRGATGVALLRLGAALPASPGAAPPALALEGGGALTASRPRWWPPGWGAEAA